MRHQAGIVGDRLTRHGRSQRMRSGVDLCLGIDRPNALERLRKARRAGIRSIDAEDLGDATGVPIHHEHDRRCSVAPGPLQLRRESRLEVGTRIRPLDDRLEIRPDAMRQRGHLVGTLDITERDTRPRRSIRIEEETQQRRTGAVPATTVEHGLQCDQPRTRLVIEVVPALDLRETGEIEHPALSNRDAVEIADHQRSQRHQLSEGTGVPLAVGLCGGGVGEIVEQVARALRVDESDSLHEIGMPVEPARHLLAVSGGEPVDAPFSGATEVVRQLLGERPAHGCRRRSARIRRFGEAPEELRDAHGLAARAPHLRAAGDTAQTRGQAVLGILDVAAEGVDVGAQAVEGTLRRAQCRRRVKSCQRGVRGDRGVDVVSARRAIGRIREGCRVGGGRIVRDDPRDPGCQFSSTFLQVGELHRPRVPQRVAGGDERLREAAGVRRGAVQHLRNGIRARDVENSGIPKHIPPGVHVRHGDLRLVCDIHEPLAEPGENIRLDDERKIGDGRGTHQYA
ncbi:hypothetical protein SRABI128_03082 [Microbacterium sp. Bi128]|nr:hypothetical protein SRABI128_03082 [Microbacterium sp. Bi128]